jgi:hypothetical protein
MFPELTQAMQEEVAAALIDLDPAAQARRTDRQAV